MDLSDFGRLLLRRLPLIAGTTVVGLLLAVALSVLQPRLLQATAVVFVAPRAASDLQDVSSGSNVVQEMVKSYAAVATTPLVLQPVIDELQLNESPSSLAKRVSATASLDTVLITIDVDDTNGPRAQRIADAIASELTAAVGELTPLKAGSAALAITSVQSATIAAQPVSPRPAILLPLGLLIGLIAGVIVAALLETLRPRPNSVRDAQRMSGLTVLAGVPRLGRRDRRPPIAPGDPRADAIRTLRARLLGRTSGPSFSAVFAAPTRSTGTVSAVVDLAVSFAEIHRSVVLVEADLRRPILSHLLDLTPTAGLADVLEGESSIDEALIAWGPAGLRVVAAGPPTDRGSDLVQGPRMAEVIADLATRFDVVLYAAAPLDESADGAVLGARTAGVLIVCTAGRTPVTRLRAATRIVRDLGSTPLGVVLLGIPRRGPDSPMLVS